MGNNPASKPKDLARSSSKGPSSGTIVPFTRSSSSAIVPFAVPPAATAVKRRLVEDSAAAAATLIERRLSGDSGGQVAVAATPEQQPAFTFAEDESEGDGVAPMTITYSAPQKRKRAPTVHAAAPAAAAAPAVAAAPEKSYAVERCPREMKCRNCKSAILEGALRFQRRRSAGVMRKRSQHLGCSRPPSLASIDELHGF